MVSQIRVKQLVWSKPHETHTYPEWRAFNFDIGFEALIDKGMAACYGKFPLSINGIMVNVKFETVESAKAYAQENYESRILRAMEATPPQPAAPVVEGLSLDRIQSLWVDHCVKYPHPGAHIEKFVRAIEAAAIEGK